MTPNLRVLLIALSLGCANKQLTTTNSPAAVATSISNPIELNVSEMGSAPRPMVTEPQPEFQSDGLFLIAVKSGEPDINALRSHLLSTLPGVELRDSADGSQLVVYLAGLQEETLRDTPFTASQTLEEVASITRSELPLQAPRLRSESSSTSGKTGTLRIENGSHKSQPATVHIDGIEPIALPPNTTLILNDVEIGTYLVRLVFADGSTSEHQLRTRLTE